MENVKKELYCKLCRDTGDTGCQVIESTENVALNCLNLDLGVTETDVICTGCSESLSAAFNFKLMCLETEDNITPYVHSTENLIDIKEIYVKVKDDKKLIDMLENPKICRLCFQLVTCEFKSIIELNVDVAHEYIPEINFFSVDNPILCKTCFDSLCNHSTFLKNCLDRKEDVRNTQLESNQGHIKTEEFKIKSEEVEIKSEEDEQSSSFDSTTDTVIPDIQPVLHTDESKKLIQNWLEKHRVNNSSYVTTSISSPVAEEKSILQESSQNVVWNAKKWKRKKTLCKFCNIEVLNFERHLKRHKNHNEVAEMLSLPKKSKERAQIIALLRKEGQFQEYLKGTVRPVLQRRNLPFENYSPCADCKGLYSKRLLSRHKKKCIVALAKKDPKKASSLSASQTLVACALDNTNTLQSLRVKDEVFNIMRADKISLIAKTDFLIYRFGEQYLRKREGKHMATMCSNKMRELAKLLYQVRLLKNDAKCKLIDIIDSVMFRTVIECARRISGYDTNKKTYRAPSLFTNIRASLRQVSDILIHLINQRDASVQLSDPERKLEQVRRFKELLVTKWVREVSSLENNLNKPLTKDMFKFKGYISQIADKCTAVLREDPCSKEDFDKLVEAALVLTIFYNRTRVEDLQCTKLETYLDGFSSANRDLHYSLPESEKVLTKRCKRVVTVGEEGSEPIVVLFPADLQNFVDLIVNIRQSTTLVPSDNPYLFAYCNSGQWVRGDVAVRKLADGAELEHPNELSSDKLRKQILNFKEDEMVQVADFTGPAGKADRLPQNTYHTAKVSKVLIKSLDEIDINPKTDLAESDEFDDDTPLSKIANAVKINFMLKSPQFSTSSNVKPHKQIGRTPWDPEQVEVVKEHFQFHILNKKPPKKDECQQLIDKHPLLFENKDWVRVKTFVYNTYRDKKKKDF